MATLNSKDNQNENKNNKFNEEKKEKESKDFNKNDLNLKETPKENKFYIYSENLNRGQWTPKEDELLLSYIKKNGPYNWTQCAQNIPQRNGKQCREHWENVLRPELKKGEWTLEEDLLIMISYKLCKGSWSKMIKNFEGRTENSIKNRFFSQLRKIVNYEKKTKAEKYNKEFLVKYLEKGIYKAKLNYISEYQINENQFNNYLNKLEKNIKDKLKEKKNQRNKDFDINLLIFLSFCSKINLG